MAVSRTGILLSSASQIKPAISGLQPPITGVAEAVVWGGYPEPNTRTEPRARQWFRQYLNAIIQRDVQDIANIRDGDELLRLLQLIALRTGSLINISNLAQDTGLQRDTIGRYLSVLERLFLMDRDGGVRASMMQQGLECILDYVGDRLVAPQIIASSRIHHDGYNVPAERFDSFFIAIRDAFRDILGADWTPDKEREWARLLAEFAAIR